MNNNSPEIQKFLDSVKEETRTSGGGCELVSFGDFWAEKYSANDTNFSKGAFLGDVSVLQEHNQVNYYKELTSYHKGISVLVLPIKRVIRKLMAFLFLPVVAEQNEINLSVARLFMQMRSYVNSDSSVKEQRSSREIEMELRLRSQQDTIEELSGKVEELTRRLAAIEEGGDEK